MIKYVPPQELPKQVIYTILTKMFETIPELMTVIAPKGWKSSPYHHEMMEERRSLYSEFLDAVTDVAKKRIVNPTNIADLKADDDSMVTFDEYFAITFPSLHNDNLELFYIVSELLSCLTSPSTLQETGSESFYYIDGDELYEQLFAVAYDQQSIDEYTRDVKVSICTCPILEYMDSINCYELILKILKNMGYQLSYWDSELLEIMELQNNFHYLDVASLATLERESQRNQTIERIEKIIAQYTKKEMDPLDFEAIVELFNQKKISPEILAYLHAYGLFPEGYPLIAESYYNLDDEDDDDLF